MQSIEKDGVLVPLLARPNPNGEGYELISGHRRKAACEWAGVTEVPVIVRDLDNCQAVIAMVDSNLQRENIKPSEKAFAYRMKLEAMNRQGKRVDLTSCKLGTKLEDNPMLEVHKIIPIVDEDGVWRIDNFEKNSEKRTDAELARQVGESQRQIHRYIRLTYLIPKILDMVDEGKVAFTIAVELSYLKEEEQNAEAVLRRIKMEKLETQCALRQESYVRDRRYYEDILRNEFMKKGGKVERSTPHYMVVEHSP